MAPPLVHHPSRRPAPPTPSARPRPPPPPPQPPHPPPTPPPPPPPPMGAMSLVLTGCNGGVVIGWSPISDPSFAKYRTLRSASPNIPVAYPPQGGAVEVGTAKSATITASSGFDASSTAGVTHYYRTVAVNGVGAVIATSGVGSAAAQPVQGMGPLVVTPDAGGTRFSWTPFTGAGACFTYYKLAYTLD